MRNSDGDSGMNRLGSEDRGLTTTKTTDSSFHEKKLSSFGNEVRQLRLYKNQGKMTTDEMKSESESPTDREEYRTRDLRFRRIKI